MKYLIALRGTASHGKSCTLNHLRELLEHDPRYKVHVTPHPNGYDSSLTATDTEDDKIGVISFGDPGAEEHVDVLLNQMKDAGVTKICAASRTRGGVAYVLDEFAAKNDFTVISGTPLYAGNCSNENVFDNLNHSMAQMLKTLVEQL